jgi:uroporphyrinogen-III synthase
MEIQPLADPSSVREAWQHLAQFDWVFFVSPNAVQQFFAVDLHPATPKSDRIQKRPLPWSPAVQVGALGPGTAQALGEAGVPSSQVTAPPPQAEQVDSEALWAQLSHQAWGGRRVMIVRGDGGRDWLADQLRTAGAEVQFVQAYRRTLPRWSSDQQTFLTQALADPVTHLWLFSSSQSIDHLLQLCPQGQAIWPRSSALATHPRIADRARAAGFGRTLQTAPDLQAMVTCIQSASW